MSKQTPITFATGSSHGYKTITTLVKDQRGAKKPVDSVTATVRIGREYVDLSVPDSVYSKPYKNERRWRTTADVGRREYVWCNRLRNQVFDLAERL